MPVNKKFLGLILAVSAVLGCASPVEISKTVWGSSTRALEEARPNGIIKTYDISLNRCYDEALKAVQDEGYVIFINNKQKATIVVMGIKGNVNTTEVGIFFSEITNNQTKIYISSLASTAKRTVAEHIYPKLDTAFGVEDTQPVTTIDEKQSP